MPVVEQAVQHGADRGHVSQQLAPVLHGTVGSQQRTGTLVTSHDNLQQIFRGGQGQFAHAEIIDDQQRHRSQGLQVFFSSAVDDGVGQFIEQHMRLAVPHAVALLDGAWPMACAK